MKKTAFFFILLSITTLIVGSCSIEKRVHNNGFHISWKKNYKVDESSHEQLTQAPIENDEKKIVPLSTNEKQEKVVHFETEEIKNLVDQSLIEKKVHSIPEKKSAVVQSISSENHSPQQLQVDSFETNHVDQKELRKSSANTGGKSQVVALILVLLVGVLGIHRFYLGYTGIGILMLLTVGCCGILALIDLIRIITGDLKPRNSDYTETL